MEEHVQGLRRENEYMRRMLHIMQLDREIDAMQQEIHRTLSFLESSTPARLDTHRGRPGVNGLSTIKREIGIQATPNILKKSTKPRRLLPATPLKVTFNDFTCQTEGMDDRPGKFVTERTKKVTVPEEKKVQGTETGTSHGVTMKPATYDGTSAWADYKAHFEACASLNRWSDDKKGLYLSVSLRGQAQGVFGNLAGNTTDYKKLVCALEDRFAPPNQTELYRVQLRDRQQRATETMAELGQDVRRLTNLAYPSAPNDVRETLAKEQFVDSLTNPDMRLKIKQARPVSLNDAIRHAVELESFYRAEKRQQGFVRTIEQDRSSNEREIISHCKRG